MGLRLPTRTAKDPNQGGNNLYPEGEWLMTLDNTREKTAPDFFFGGDANANGSRPPTTGTMGTQLGLAFLGQEALTDGNEVPGQKRLFFDLLIEDGDNTLDDEVVAEALADSDTDPEHTVGWRQLGDARRFVNLAMALGATTEAEGVTEVSDDALTELRNGSFDGTEVIITVQHRTSKRTKNQYHVLTFAPTT